MSNAMRPEDELRPTDEGGLAAAPARPSAADARAAVTGGFDVGAAAAAVAAAAAQPLAAPLLQDVAPLEPAWRAAAAVLAPTAIAPAGEAAPDLRAEVPPDAPYAFDGAGEDLADPAAGAVATADAAAAPAAGDAADGASDHALDPASARAVDPASGWVIEPNSGWLVEPTTGYLLDPGTGYYVEPTTGYYVDPSTGYLLDPATGYPLDPATGYPFDPATGLPIDVSAYQDAAAATAPVEAGSGDVAVEAPPDLGIAHAELVAGEAETQPALDVAAAEVEVAVAVADSLPTDRLPTESPPAAELPSVAEPEVEIDQVAIEQVAIEHGADADDEATLLPSAGFAPTADLSGDVEERSSEEVPAAAAEPPSAVEVASPSGSAEPTPARDLFTDLPAGDALSFSAEPIDAFAAPGEAPFDDVAAIGFTDVESERDAAGAAEEPLVGPPLDLWEAFGPAPDATGDAGTSPAEPVSHAAAPADDGGKTTMWDLGAAAAGGQGREPDAWPGPEDAARLDDVALASGGSFDLATGGIATAAEPVQAADLPAFDLADDSPRDAPSQASDQADAAESAWAGQAAIPPGESGIDFSAFESPPAAPQEACAAGEVQVDDAEILDVAEEDIVQIGDDVEAIDEVELTSAPELEAMAAPAIELPPEPAPAAEDEPRAAEATVDAAEFPEPTTAEAPPPAAWDFFSPSFAAHAPPPTPLAFAEPHEEASADAAAADAAEPAAAPAVPLAFAAPEVEAEPPPALAPPPAPPSVIALGPVDEAPRPGRARNPFDPFADLPDVAALTAAPPPPPQPAAVVAEVADAAQPPSSLPEPMPEPAAPDPDPGAFVSGKHRVVVHTADGQVKRGALVDAALDGPEVVIDAAGSGREAIPSARIKAIFFMLPTGETPPTPEGRRVRVTFRDGRQVAGFSRDYAPERSGFFMVPADTRTHTARIWVYQAAVRQVSVS